MKIFAETERLILREIVPEDENGFWELDSDPEVHRYLGNQPVTDIDQIRTVIKSVRQQYIDNGIGRWAMIEKQSGAFIGWTGLKLVKDVTNGHVNFHDVGYRLIRKYWGQGFATESAKASVDYAFGVMRLEDLYAVTEIGNIASRQVLEKSGLKWIEIFEADGMQYNWLRLNKAGYYTGK